VHSHNLPDSLTVLANDVLDGRVPVLHDVHDLQSLRVTPYEDGFPEPADPLDLEKRAVEESDALMTVSEELLDEIEARHDVPPTRLVFPNYALRRDLPDVLPPRPPPNGDGRMRVVYQGSLATNGGHYDLREIFVRLVAGGVLLDVYPVRPSPAYTELAHRTPGLTCHDPLTPARLLRVLPSYDAGWAGFNARLNGPHLDTVLPNKLYEYLGCGLPVLTLNHRALARLVEEEDVGLRLDEPEQAAERLASADLDALREHVAAARDRFTVEANIGRVAELYATVAEARPARR
jgi:glycosyltransferase involved in cell wall biosynthesis